MEAETISSLIGEITSLGQHIDAKSRQLLQKKVQDLSYALETPGDTVQRVAYLPLRTAGVRTAMNLNLYKKLVDAGDGATPEELAKGTEADPKLLERILRYCTAIGTMGQKENGKFYATNISKAMIMPLLEAGIKHTFDSCGPAFMKMPEYLAKNKYQQPVNPMDCPFQMAFNTDLHLFPWFMAPEQSEKLDFFNTWMAGSREGRNDWYEFYPVETNLFKGFSTEKDGVMFVDVAGGRGHEIKAFRKKFPDAPGRYILQDLPETVAQVDKSETDFEPTAYDFFTPQPIHGARFYYFRQVMHDWPDDKCIEILKNTVASMKPGYSRIIINDMVVADVGAGVVPTQLDLLMLSMCASQERTESSWRQLIPAAGLKLVKIWTLEEGVESIIECTLAEEEGLPN